MKKKYAEDIAYQQEITNILDELSQIAKSVDEQNFELQAEYNSVVNKINDVLSKKFVTREDYEIISKAANDIAKKITEYIEIINKKRYREKIEKKLKQKLEELGYKLISQNPETQVMYIDTKFSKEYKIMLKLTDDDIYVKFVRIIPDGYILTE